MEQSSQEKAPVRRNAEKSTMASVTSVMKEGGGAQFIRGMRRSGCEGRTARCRGIDGFSGRDDIEVELSAKGSTVEIRTISVELSSMRDDTYQEDRRRQWIQGGPGEMGVWRESDDASGADICTCSTLVFDSATSVRLRLSISQASHVSLVPVERARDLQQSMR